MTTNRLMEWFPCSHCRRNSYMGNASDRIQYLPTRGVQVSKVTKLWKYSTSWITKVWFEHKGSLQATIIKQLIWSIKPTCRDVLSNSPSYFGTNVWSLLRSISRRIINSICDVRGYESESVAKESLFSGGPSEFAKKFTGSSLTPNYFLSKI